MQCRPASLFRSFRWAVLAAIATLTACSTAWANESPRPPFPGHDDAFFLQAFEVQMKTRPRPDTPDDVVQLDKVTCTVVVILEPAGTPVEVELEPHASQGCTEPFEEEVRRASMDARWYPLPDINGGRRRAVIRLRINFEQPVYPLRRPKVPPGTDRATCRVKFLVSRSGKPKEMSVVGPCPKPDVVLERARHWRWKLPKKLTPAPVWTARDVAYD